ncbi:hypothetical protein BCR33DRAFT_410477 [Rhizoclosmatium globosum]|uniref:Uncharacterized protein n=1 Tax=Rhizoclosmatium globosum TaxID=329046 RepID=A0A1Y2BX37_9FUNG|nr:hypothetical protein BCR33DRAFT_410477 [Rhizoclosmatium globosum]|eukprot:ORY39313.1 hypothetical protein BCR33DRAFT_410477 [Rhizoclosmatium globosum]
MAFIMTDIPNQHTVDLDGTSLSAHEKLQFLKERHPNSCRIFYESLKETLSTLLYDVESVSLQEDLIRYLEEGTQGTNAESQAETPSYVIETVSFLSIWCTVKGELLSFGDAMTNTMIQQAINPRARQSSVYRIALMSKSDESYLFNTSLVISTVIQAETNTLNHLVSDFPSFKSRKVMTYIQYKRLSSNNI